jgi:hypothetical protein
MYEYLFKMKMVLKKWASVFFLAIPLLFSCKKNSSATITGVPNVAVNFSVDITNPLYANLSAVGGWVYVTGGYDGIIVYRQSTTTFLAFDRGCPYDCESNSKSIVAVQSNNIFATCPVCGTQYAVNSGTVSNKGPGTLALKQYNATFDGSNIIKVSN